MSDSLVVRRATQRSIFDTEIMFEDLLVGHDHIMLHEQINT